MDRRNSENGEPQHWEIAAEWFNNKDWKPMSSVLDGWGHWFGKPARELPLMVPEIEPMEQKKKCQKMHSQMIEMHKNWCGSGNGKDMITIMKANQEDDDEPLEAKEMGLQGGDKVNFLKQHHPATLHLWHTLEVNGLMESCKSETPHGCGANADDTPSASNSDSSSGSSAKKRQKKMDDLVGHLAENQSCMQEDVLNALDLTTLEQQRSSVNQQVMQARGHFQEQQNHLRDFELHLAFEVSDRDPRMPALNEAKNKMKADADANAAETMLNSLLAEKESLASVIDAAKSRQHHHHQQQENQLDSTASLLLVLLKHK